MWKVTKEKKKVAFNFRINKHIKINNTPCTMYSACPKVKNGSAWLMIYAGATTIEIPKSAAVSIATEKDIIIIDSKYISSLQKGFLFIRTPKKISPLISSGENTLSILMG